MTSLPERLRLQRRCRSVPQRRSRESRRRQNRENCWHFIPGLTRHSSLTTTEVYVRADPTEKLEAIEAIVPPCLRKGKFRPPDKLLALLKAKP